MGNRDKVDSKLKFLPNGIFKEIISYAKDEIHETVESDRFF
jgi:hypothetical protein